MFTKPDAVVEIRPELITAPCEPATVPPVAFIVTDAPVMFEVEVRLMPAPDVLVPIKLIAPVVLTPPAIWMAALVSALLAVMVRPPEPAVIVPAL